MAIEMYADINSGAKIGKVIIKLENGFLEVTAEGVVNSINKVQRYEQDLSRAVTELKAFVYTQQDLSNTNARKVKFIIKDMENALKESKTDE